MYKDDHNRREQKSKANIKEKSFMWYQQINEHKMFKPKTPNAQNLDQMNKFTRFCCLQT